jgi:hypothetical protein
MALLMNFFANRRHNLCMGILHKGERYSQTKYKNHIYLPSLCSSCPSSWVLKTIYNAKGVSAIGDDRNLINPMNLRLSSLVSASNTAFSPSDNLSFMNRLQTNCLLQNAVDKAFYSQGNCKKNHLTPKILSKYSGLQPASFLLFGTPSFSDVSALSRLSAIFFTKEKFSAA